MVNANARLFLVTGSDFPQRHAAIENIKKNISAHLKLSSLEGLPTLIFYAKEIELRNFEEQVATLSFRKEKIILVKDVQALAKDVKEFLLKNMEKVLSVNYLILETERDHAQFSKEKKIATDPFFMYVAQQATLARAGSAALRISLDDFIKKLRAKDLSSTLFILRKLFEQESSLEGKELLGLKVLGILIGSFSYTRDQRQKQKCFDYLWSADRAVKEKGLDTLLVLEYTITKLLRS